jgi:hypothetical protein
MYIKSFSVREISMASRRITKKNIPLVIRRLSLSKRLRVWRASVMFVATGLYEALEHVFSHGFVNVLLFLCLDKNVFLLLIESILVSLSSLCATFWSFRSHHSLCVYKYICACIYTHIFIVYPALLYNNAV